MHRAVAACGTRVARALVSSVAMLAQVIKRGETLRVLRRLGSQLRRACIKTPAITMATALTSRAQ